MNQIKLSELPTLAQQLQTADYIPVVHSGDTYKYSLFDYMVKNSGNETIAGVKTFSSSPVVPTPTTDMQASTKKYVDNNITGLKVGLPSGIATLDSTGKVPSTQMPQLVITDVFVVATQAAMLALTTAEQGDIAKRTDYTPAKTFILSASPASTLSNWVELTVSADPNTPTSDQKAALAGTGTPSASNPYATDSSLVPLEAFKLYDPDYPYALNEPCFYDGVPYKSLSADNTGHQPDNSPLYWEVTGGSGETGNIGYSIPNGQFENGTVTDWSTYADAAADTPVDGTGGTANTTFTATATEPLVGSYSGLITKAGSANRQGEGVATPITIDSGLTNAPCQVKLVYNTSANYVASDICMFVYDIAGSVLCPVNNKALAATFTTPGSHVFQFFPNLGHTHYRIIFHIASTSALDYTVKIDNVQIGGKESYISPAMTPWVDYTPTFTGFGTVTINKAQWRRDGEEILLNVKFTSGTSTAVEAQMTLPGTYTSKANIATIEKVGYGIISSTSVAQFAIYDEPSKGYVTFGFQSSAGAGFIKQLGSNVLSSGQIMSFDARIPCAQFSVNTVYNGINEPFYISNTESSLATNGVSTKTKLGLDGSAIVANTSSAGFYFDMTLPRALLPNETPKVQVRSKIDGNWYDADDAIVPSLFVKLGSAMYTDIGTSTLVQQQGISLAKSVAGQIRVYFCAVYGASALVGVVAVRTWANITSASDCFDNWRVRIGQAGMSEVKPIVFASYYSATLSGAFTSAMKVEDTYSAINASNQWVVPFDGIYEFELGVAATTSGAAALAASIIKDSITIATNYENAASGYGIAPYCARKIRCTKGSLIGFQITGQTANGAYVTVLRVGD